MENVVRKINVKKITLGLFIGIMVLATEILYFDIMGIMSTQWIHIPVAIRWGISPFIAWFAWANIKYYTLSDKITIGVGITSVVLFYSATHYITDYSIIMIWLAIICLAVLFSAITHRLLRLYKSL